MLNKLDLELFKILDSDIDKRFLYLNLIKNNKGNKPIDKWLGYYPTTNTLLRYFCKKNLLINNHTDYPCLCIYNNNWYYLDITKEIKDYDDKQKQELIEFLNNL